MKTRSHISFSLTLGMALLAGMLAAACSSTPQGKPRTSVEERAQDYLNLLIAQDYAAAYEYLSPGYRSGTTLVDFQREQFGRRARLVDGRLGESDCSQGVCKVRVLVDYVIFGALPGVSEFKSKSAYTENWIQIDDIWFLVPE